MSIYIYQVGEEVSTQVRDVFIQAAPILRWQDRIKNKEVLQMAVMENLREDVWTRRWKFIGHITRKEPNNDYSSLH